MTDIVFNQLSKEMATYVQMNPKLSWDELRQFFLYELELRCVSKMFLQEISKEIEPDNQEATDGGKAE